MIEQLEHILFSSSQIGAEFSMLIGIVALILLIAFGKKNSQFRSAAWLLTLASFVLALFIVELSEGSTVILFNNLLISNAVSNLGKELVLIASIFILLHIRLMKYDFTGEYYILILTIVLGLFVLLMASNFMSLFISLEMISICSYMLVALQGKAKNLEAGIKYLLFGAASTAIMLFGISYLFGASGSFNFHSEEFKLALSNNSSWLIQTAVAMTLAGPLFKLSAAPFHIWAPDVYEASPSPIISFLAIAPKIGALFVIYKIILFIPFDTTFLLGSIILLSILVGNFAALSQKDSKRMLGYSGIAQAGFMMIGLLALESSGFEATIFYLSVYLFASVGSFFLLDVLYFQTSSFAFKSMAGLSQNFTILGITGLIFMIALVGLPPTAGFTSKFLIFSSIWDSYTSGGHQILVWILIFGIANTAVSIYYYFKIPFQMFVKKSAIVNEDKRLPYSHILPLIVLALVVLSFFFAPQLLQDRIQLLF